MHFFSLYYITGCEVAHPVTFGSPIEPLTNTVGSILKYQCLRTHVAVGKPESYCMKNGEWSKPNFKCVRGKCHGMHSDDIMAS